MDCKYKRVFTLQLNFLRPSVFDLHTDDSDPILHSVKKGVLHETYKLFWDNLLPSFIKDFNFQKRKFTTPFSLQLHFNLQTAYTNGLLRNYDPLKEQYLFTTKNFPDRPLINALGCLNSTDSAKFVFDCFPITVAQPYKLLSKVFDHPLNDKALKKIILLLRITIHIANFSF